MCIFEYKFDQIRWYRSSTDRGGSSEKKYSSDERKVSKRDQMIIKERIKEFSKVTSMRETTHRYVKYGNEFQRIGYQ